ncbi:MAG: FKBP-type peptidyl-prolyl cis-trans isomerase 2 [Nitrospinales bacterium]|jgi:FKBP-type peptidyl-prolyl cis-trans isomerase 2
MSDKRGFPRSLVDLQVSTQVEDNRIEGKVIDLTVEGISMEFDHPLKAGATVAIEIKQNQEVKKNELKIEVIRCLPTESDTSRYHIVAKFIEPNDEFLMDALALVHGKGPKQDRRGTIYGDR